MFSSASRFSKPMSQESPNGWPAEGGRESLMIGIRALGNILTVNEVSVIER